MFVAVDLFPAVLSVRYLNMFYVLATQVWASQLSPWHVAPEHISEIRPASSLDLYICSYRTLHLHHRRACIEPVHKPS